MKFGKTNKNEHEYLNSKRYTRSLFRKAWWLPGPHLQTCFPTLARKAFVEPDFQRFHLPDGDFIDLCWARSANNAKLDAPIVLILHGLEGSWKSPYAQGLLHTCREMGWRAAVMHFRGCSGTDNRLARSYHSGDTADPRYIIQELRRRYPKAPLVGVGYSMGGNVLLKLLGEDGENCQLDAGVAVCVPLLLDVAVTRINQGFSKIYKTRLIRNLKKHYLRKKNLAILPMRLRYTHDELKQIKDFFSFDDKITAPLHGFESAVDYYRKCSSRSFLGSIRKPTLIIQAYDDPFMTPDVLPKPSELSESVTIELSPKGGHVGFVSGKLPWKPEYWLEKRIPEFFKSFLS